MDSASLARSEIDSALTTPRPANRLRVKKRLFVGWCAWIASLPFVVPQEEKTFGTVMRNPSCFLGRETFVFGGRRWGRCSQSVPDRRTMKAIARGSSCGCVLMQPRNGEALHLVTDASPFRKFFLLALLRSFLALLRSFSIGESLLLQALHLGTDASLF